MSIQTQTAKHLVTRSSRLFIAALFVATFVPQILNVKPAAADDGGYPWIGATTVNASTGDFGYSTCPSNDTNCMLLTGSLNGTTYGEADPWVYNIRNCTSYAAWKVNAQFGANVHGWGNAATWNTGASNAGYTVYNGSGHTPVEGELAQWGTEKDGGLGHVAYVGSVNSGVATLWEYNVGLDGLFYNNRTTASTSAGTPDHYIHIGTVSPLTHKADIVVHDASTSNWSVATSTGTGFSGAGVGLTGWSKGDWSGLGDVTGDGMADIVTHNNLDGNWYVAKSNGTTFSGTGSAWLTGWGAGDWAGLANVSGHTNGEEDLVIHSGTTFYVAVSNGSSFASPQTWLTGWGIGDWVGLGDVTGNGKADLVVHNSSNNTYAVALSNGSSFSGNGTWLSGWSAGQWAGLADVTGDGKADLVVFNSSNNQFVEAHSTGSGFSGDGQWFSGWGIGDWVGLADVTGNGKADIIVHDGTNNYFNVLLSSGSSFSSGGTWLTGWSAGDWTQLGDVNGKD